jgi:hypothetical protein
MDRRVETPVRVQLSRKKGWKMPENTVKVDRSTRFGNPITCSRPYGCPKCAGFEREAWTHEDGTVSPYRCCVEAYRHYVETGLSGEPTRAGYIAFGIDGMEGYPRRQKLIDGLASLRGKNLACWCGLDQPCHADVLLDLANSPVSAQKGKAE